MVHTRKKAVLILCAAILILAGVLLLLLYNGALQFNHPPKEKYPVRGVDVSSYQGAIDWNVLSGQGIRFAYIKATEGSTFQDSRFRENWENASKTKLRIGAYHFFSFDSKGTAQAENFVNTVVKKEGMLPPVVDVEFYGDKKERPPAAAEVKANLQACLDTLEACYGLKPILYATSKSYDLYIKDDFEGYDVWIRNIVSQPSLSDGRPWTFWQYTDRMVLDGYAGTERFIDMNVFCGSDEEFLRYAETVMAK